VCFSDVDTRGLVTLQSVNSVRYMEFCKVTLLLFFLQGMGCDLYCLLFQQDKWRPNTVDKVLNIINTYVLIK